MLGKTRQSTCVDPGVGPARGVLAAEIAPGCLRHARMAVPEELTPWVAHCWLARWSFDDDLPHAQETLPHPNCHLVYEPDGWTLAGVHRGKFRKVLHRASFGFGVKFTPAGLRPFLGQPVATLANRVVDAETIFGEALREVFPARGADLLSEDEMTVRACAFLLDRKPEPNAEVVRVNAIVATVLRDPSLSTVEALAARAGMGVRTLERLFREYVGASPKWVIRRYRLHEAVERCHTGQTPDFAQLAAELGYYDQAHLITDFRRIVGYTPAQYAKRARSRS